MRIRIGWLVVLGIFIGIGVYIYLFFNGGENLYTQSNQEFSMNISDIVNVDKEIYIKYKKVIDNRCKEEDCEREGEKLAKLLVINNPNFEYIELSSIHEEEIPIEKTDYKVKLINFDVETNELTLKILKEEK